MEERRAEESRSSKTADAERCIDNTNFVPIPTNAANRSENENRVSAFL
ncbi:MAG: hypothetical protein MR419_03495 [Clostridiales bacterium]|nr:hypothetical protein [Clostridiales bacterium]MDY4171156.1 hypothetical protein [Evtepia sp.]